tara:strand:+ start:528 stop:815 length:288 start_codon:yes stop_codon:yes gene_type:complete
MDKGEEIERMTNLAIEQANNNWFFPFAIVGGLCLIIITLLLNTWKIDRKKSEKRHVESTKRHKEHEDTIIELRGIATRLTVLVERNIDDIKVFNS